MKKNYTEIMVFGVFAVLGLFELVATIIDAIAGQRISLFNIVSGTIMLIVGLIPSIHLIKQKQKRKNLEVNGQVLHATIEEVRKNYNYRVNHRSPYLVYCTYKDPYNDVLYRFKSENLWEDPTSYCQPGSSINVVVNPNEYSEYYVDVEEKKNNSLMWYHS